MNIYIHACLLMLSPRESASVQVCVFVCVSVLDNAYVSMTSCLKKRDKWKFVKEIRKTDKGAAAATQQQEKLIWVCVLVHECVSMCVSAARYVVSSK